MSNWGQAAFTVIGGIVGAIVGGPLNAVKGAAWGYSIGSAAFPTDLPPVSGPRIDDLAAQDASYGADIPKGWGTPRRFPGNVIWQAPAVEHVHTSDGGGKGGPSQEQTTYTYTRSFAIGIHDGEIDGVRKVWRDNVLVYSVDDAGNSLLSEDFPITFYLGTEDQPSDSLMEADKGAGNVPAYRGLAYCVIEDEDVTAAPKRIPQYEFEVVRAGELPTGSELVNTVSMPTASASVSGHKTITTGNWLVAVEHNGDSSDSQNLHVYEKTSTGLVLRWSYIPFTDRRANEICLMDNGYIVVFFNYAGTSVHRSFKTYILDPETGALSDTGLTVRSQATGSTLDFNGVPYQSDQESWRQVTASGDYLLFYSQGGGAYGGSGEGYFCLYKEVTINPGPSEYQAWDVVYKTVRYGYQNYPFGIHSQGGYFCVVGATTCFCGGIRLGKIDTVAESFSFLTVIATTAYKPVFHPSGEWCIVDDKLYSRVGDVLTYAINLPISIAKGEPLWSSDGNYLFIGKATTISGGVYPPGGVFTYSFDPDTPSFTLVSSTPPNYSSSYYVTGAIFADDMLVFSNLNETDTDRTWNLFRYFQTTIIPETVTFASIATDICADSSLPSTDIDVSLTTTIEVRGYLRTRRMSGRAALEPLLMTFQVDVAEINGKLTFVPRGGASVVTIPEDELAAHEYGLTDFNPFPTVRKQETELPRSVSLKHPDVGRDYQVGTQTVSRLVTTSVNDITIETPVVLSSTEAKQLADIIQTHAWMARHSHSLKTGMKYGYLTPTDVITVLRNSGSSHELKLLDINRSANGITTLNTVDEDAAAYSSTSTAVDGDWVSQALVETPEVALVLLDIPILRDQDNSAGIYYVIYGTAGAFSGAALYRSTDDTTFSLMDSWSVEATVGTTSDALADGPTEIIDLANSVTVLFANGSVSSVTETQMLNGSNYALIGAAGRWEIIQFQTATLIDTDTYTLTNLIRGRQGTEHNTANHAIGDTFILLDSAIKRLDMSSSAIGTSYYWRIVAFGAQVATATSQSFANNGENLECFSPVNIHGVRDASDNLTITWQHRTRFGGEWKDYTGIPLNEAFQAYEIDILDGATVVRTIEVTSETASYTAAQQTTDFGSAQASLDIEIYQISDTVGRGHKGEATI